MDKLKIFERIPRGDRGYYTDQHGNKFICIGDRWFRRVVISKEAYEEVAHPSDVVECTKIISA